MPLDKRHSHPNKSERTAQYYHPIYKMNSHSVKEFNRVERVLDEATCDLINGKAKSDILLKLQNGMYESQNGKGITHNNALEYYNAILSRLQIDEPDKDNARTAFYSMYLNLYNEAMENGNTIVAKQILDSMVKLMGLEHKQDTNIQINSDTENGILINFGFNKNDT